MAERGVPCVSCTHDGVLHEAEGHCRLNGCPCKQFTPPRSAEEKPVAPGTRRVAIDLPDGYMLSVSLVPYSGGDVDVETVIEGATTVETTTEVDDG